MSDFQQFGKWLIRAALKVCLIGAPLLLGNFLAASASKGTPSLNLLGLLINLAVLLFAGEIAAWFVQAFYGLQTRASARGFLLRQVFGQGSANPYLLAKEGTVDTKGNEVAQKIGGPVLLIIYNDSAVVLEQAGRLTRVVRGPASLELASFERVWDCLDLRPQRWSFPVSAMTRDGIPITYEADIQFQIGETDDDVFKAATSKWVKEASSSEPDRLRIWTKQVVIRFVEGALRTILSHYEMDQLIDSQYREEVRQELERRLIASVPQIGAKILNVTLGELKLKDKVVEQWIDAWKAERNREIRAELARGQSERAVALEKAKGEVREHILKQTLSTFQNMAHEDNQLPARSLILSCIGVIRQGVYSNQGLFFPSDVLQVLDTVEKRLKQSV